MASVSGAKIESCRVGSIAKYNAENCEIRYCQSSQFLFCGDVRKSSISDCFLKIDINDDLYEKKTYAGGLCYGLDSSSVDRCFLMGVLFSGELIKFSGISRSATNSSAVRNCSIGKFKLNGNSSYWEARFIYSINI